MARQHLEIESLDDFDAHLANTATLAGWFVQSLDPRERDTWLREVDVAGAGFLGCRFAPEAEQALIRRGALVFPRLPGVPFDPYRAGVYTAEEL